MARTKRKVNPLKAESASSCPPPRVYHTAGYVRLSVEDGGNSGAETIEAQKELVLSYITAQLDMSFTTLYCDNGRTGTNFERPGFERLMKDVRKGKIDCIVVKDLSRFGRNYLETGMYLERLFPFLDVRFVAVNDHFDTLTAERSRDGYIIPLKNMINETYSRDISRKINSALSTKQRNGEFIGSLVPFGYQKCAADHNRLEPNEETAPIVRMIFEMRVSGTSYLQIARQLNRKGIPSPSRYHFMKGEIKSERLSHSVWHVPIVKKILQNEVYLGHMVQGRQKSVFPKEKRLRDVPKSEWIVVRGTHEPIIDESTFTKVQEMAAECRAVHQERAGRYDELGTIPNIFRGLVFCADCKSPMIRYKNVSDKCGHRYYSYICRTHTEDPASCPNRYLHETELKDILWDTLQREIELAEDLEKLARQQSFSPEAVLREKKLNREAAAAKQALSRAEMLYDSLYQNYVDHLMTEHEYVTMKRQYRADMEKAKTRLDEVNRQLQSELQITQNSWLSAFIGFRGKTELTEEMVHLLVERVEVDAENRISIYLRYRDEYNAIVKRLQSGEAEVPA